MEKKRKTLSVTDKVQIIQELENGKSNTTVCKEFNLSFSTVSTVWKKRNHSESIRSKQMSIKKDAVL